MASTNNIVQIKAPVEPRGEVLKTIKKGAMDAFGLSDCETVFVEEKSLLGGFKLVYGSRTLDMSISGKVEQIWETMPNNE